MLFSEVLKESSQFSSCFKKGRYIFCGFVTVYYIANGLEINRVGISVSKKVFKRAVDRNRAKRIIRAAYRLNESKFERGYDIVFAVRKDIDGKKTQDIEKILPKVIKDINVHSVKKNESD